MDWPEDWTHNDLSDQERCILMQMEFYPWGGGHWCSELDSGETCYPDEWAVEAALEFAQDFSRPPCAECDEQGKFCPAVEGDYLCLWHRRAEKTDSLAE